MKQTKKGLRKVEKSLKRKKLIDIKTFEYKDSKGQPKGKKFREQIAFRLKKNSKVFGVILTNFLMRGEVDYFIQSDYYKESKNKSQDFFVELLEIFNLKSYFNELDNKYKQLLERWVLNEPTIMAYYITNPTQFKLLITKIQDAYKEKGIDPMMSVGIIISSFAVSSMFTQSYSNKKNKESISDYFLESIKEQATYLGASLEAYSQARIEVNKIQNKARSEQE